VGDEPLDSRPCPGSGISLQLHSGNETVRARHRNYCADTAGKGFALFFYGILYLSRDIRLALVEASNEKIGNPVDAVLLYCCQYDPTTGKYRHNRFAFATNCRSDYPPLHGNVWLLPLREAGGGRTCDLRFLICDCGLWIGDFGLIKEKG